MGEAERADESSSRGIEVEFCRTGSSRFCFFGEGGVDEVEVEGDFGRVERGIGIGGGRVGSRKSKSSPPPSRPSTGVDDLEFACKKVQKVSVSFY
jgi:hypothetical protein